MSTEMETRFDFTDGQSYPLTEFVAAYGGSLDNPPEEWALADTRVDSTDGQTYTYVRNALN